MQEIKQIDNSRTYNVSTGKRDKRLNFRFPAFLVAKVTDLAKREGKDLTRFFEDLVHERIEREEIIPETIKEKLKQEGLLDETALRHKQIKKRYNELIILYEETKSRKDIRAMLAVEFCEGDDNLRKILYNKKK